MHRRREETSLFSGFTFFRRQGFLPWLNLGCTLSVILFVLPLVGLMLAHQSEAPLLAGPPHQWSRLLFLLTKTMQLTFGVCGITWTLGTALAWCECRYNFVGRSFLSALGFLPMAIPSYLLAAIFRELGAPRGLIGQWLGREEPFVGLGAAIFVLSITCTPYVYVLVRSALVQQNKVYEEAGKSLGAGFWRCFWSLSVPTLRPAWALSLVLVAFYTISDFGAVAVVDCEVLTWALYQSRHHPGDAASIGGLLVALVVPIVFMLRFMQGDNRWARRTQRAQPMSRRTLGVFPTLVVWLLFALVLVPGLVIPLLTLLVWSFEGWTHGAGLGSVGSLVGTTAVFAFVGTGVTLLLAIVPAWRVARYRRGAWIELAAYLTSGLPGVLMGVGLFYLVVRLGALRDGVAQGWIDGLTGTGLVLMVAYGMRFLSVGYGVLKVAFLDLDRHQERSARTLGSSPWDVFRRVTLPQIRPAFGASAVLVFVHVAKELPLTLLLAPMGYQTLAYRIFDAQQEGALPDTAFAALLLLSMVLLVQIFMPRRENHV
jgi:iron(III) transport system permease protein